MVYRLVDFSFVRPGPVGTVQCLRPPGTVPLLAQQQEQEIR